MGISTKELAGTRVYITRDIGSGEYWVWTRITPIMIPQGAWIGQVDGSVPLYLEDPEHAPNLPAEGRALAVSFPKAKPDRPKPREWDVVKCTSEEGKRLIVRMGGVLKALDMNTYRVYSSGDEVIKDFYKSGEYRVLGNLRDGYDSGPCGGPGS